MREFTHAHMEEFRYCKTSMFGASVRVTSSALFLGLYVTNDYASQLISIFCEVDSGAFRSETDIALTSVLSLLYTPTTDMTSSKIAAPLPFRIVDCTVRRHRHRKPLRHAGKDLCVVVDAICSAVDRLLFCTGFCCTLV